MTHESANSPQRPRYGDIDRIGKAGYLLAVLGALLVVIAVVMWPGPADRQSADNSAITTTGMADNPPPPIRKR
jgi:hypothetical protein